MQEKAKVQHVPVKMYRTADRLMVAAPMPGLQPEDIVVSVTDQRLVIKGELRGMLKDVKELVVDEWSVGGYYRELELPNPVDGPHANVTYGNGVLIVTLPIDVVTTPAEALTLDRTGTDHGMRVGNMGHA